MIFEEYTRKVFDDTGKTEKFLFKIGEYNCIICKHRNIDLSNRCFNCKIRDITHINIEDALDCPLFEKAQHKTI